MQTETFKVTGMTCGGCTNKVTRVLEAVSGVTEAKVSLASGEATVRYDEHLTSLDKINSSVRNAGYGVELASGDQSHKSKGGCCD